MVGPPVEQVGDGGSQDPAAPGAVRQLVVVQGRSGEDGHINPVDDQHSGTSRGRRPRVALPRAAGPPSLDQLIVARPGALLSSFRLGLDNRPSSPLVGRTPKDRPVFGRPVSPWSATSSRGDLACWLRLEDR